MADLDSKSDPELERNWDEVFFRMEAHTHFPELFDYPAKGVADLLQMINVPIENASILELGCGGDDLSEDMKSKLFRSGVRAERGLRYPPVNLAFLARDYKIPPERLYGVDIVPQFPGEDFYTHTQVNLADCYSKEEIPGLEGREFNIIFCNMVQNALDLTWDKLSKGKLDALIDLFSIVQNHMPANSLLVRLDDAFNFGVRDVSEMSVLSNPMRNSIIYKDHTNKLWYLDNIFELKFVVKKLSEGEG